MQLTRTDTVEKEEKVTVENDDAVERKIAFEQKLRSMFQLSKMIPLGIQICDPRVSLTLLSSTN